MNTANMDQPIATLNNQRWLFIFWAVHLVCWTLLPTFLQHNAPIDVIEGLTWGQQWAWGYDKHPWLAPWLTALASLLGGHAIWTIYLLSQLTIISCFWAIWRLARDILPAPHAIAAVLLLEGIFYYSFTTPEFNPNVAMLPLWSLCALLFYRAIKQQRLILWGLMGFVAGLAMMAKYFSALFLLCQFIFLLTEPTARRSWQRPGPYLALAIFVLVITPNLIWLVQHQFIALQYAMQRTDSATTTWWQHISHPLQFCLAQFFAVLPALIAFTPCLLGKKYPLPLSAFDRWFLYCLGAGPFVIVIALSAITGMELRSMYGTPLFSFIGILLVIHFCPALTVQQWHALRRNIVIIFSLFIIVFIVSTIGKPYLLGSAKRVNFPGPEVAAKLTQLWHNQYHSPLPYVAGDRWLAGNVAFYSTDRPTAYFDWSPIVSFWINEQQLRQRGALFLWDVNEKGEKLPTDIAERFPQALLLPAQEFASPIAAHKVAPIKLGVALLPPHSDAKRPDFTSEISKRGNN